MDDIIYFDNAATTFPKPVEVLESINEYYKKYGVNPGRGGYSLSLKAGEIIVETRNLLSQLFEISSDQIHFAPSVTYSLNQIIFGLSLKRNSTVYISPFEHNAVVRPLEKLKRTINIDVEVFKFNNFSFDFDQLSDFFDCDVAVLTHQSNVTGLILPVNEICREIKKINQNAITIIDGAQCGGFECIDWNYIDFYCFSGHKSLYGPSGIAGFINNSGIEIEPLIYGGTGISSESIDMPQSGHERYEAGSQNILSIIGLNASLKWIFKTRIDIIKEHNKKLTELFNEKISNIKEFIIYRDEINNFGNTVSFSHNKISPQDLELILSKNGFSLRSGLHCSPLTHKFLNTIDKGGTIRFSPGYFNNTEQVNNLINKSMESLRAQN